MQYTQRLSQHLMFIESYIYIILYILNLNLTNMLTLSVMLYN